MKKNERQSRIAICTNNRDYEMSLEVRKAYPVIPDERAAARNYLRLIDETGEDYLFPASRFVVIEVSETIERELLAAA